MCRLLMKTVLLALLLISPLAAEQEMEDFIVSVQKVIRSRDPEALKGIAVEMPADQKVVDRVFMVHELQFRGWEVLGLDQAKEKWRKMVPALVSSLTDVRAEDQVIRIDWSDGDGGQGRVSVAQYFVITKAEGGYRLRIR